jgi:uncharacterized protein GlcG (DUF336 family)
MPLTLAQAQTAIDGGLARATERGTPSCFAVVDSGGNLLAFAANETALLVCRELAIGKAYTSLLLRAPTSSLTEAVQPGGPFYGLGNALPGRPLVTFAGGQPLGDPIIGGASPAALSRTTRTSPERWCRPGRLLPGTTDR